MPEPLISTFSGFFLASWAGVAGSFIVWYRLGFLADAFAHAALLGVAIALFLKIPPLLGIVLFAVFSASLMTAFRDTIRKTPDTFVMSASSIAMTLGIGGIALYGGAKGHGHLLDYLTGTRHNISQFYAWLTWGFCVLTGAWLWIKHKVLISCALLDELAEIEGLHPRLQEFLLLMCLFGFVLLGMWWAGALVLTLWLLGPLLVAKSFVKSPQMCLVVAACVGGNVFLAAKVFTDIAHIPLGVTTGCVWSVVLGLTYGGKWLWRHVQSLSKLSTAHKADT